MCPLKRILTSSVLGLLRGNIYLSAFNKEMLQFFFVLTLNFARVLSGAKRVIVQFSARIIGVVSGT